MRFDHDPFNMIISGVGGQGNILVSDLISRAYCEEGYFVTVGETYGATQRGGSVVSHVRLSRKRTYGPLIPLGQCHIIVGFEPLEVLRILSRYGHDDVQVISNDRPFYPLDVLQKKRAYPTKDALMSAIRHLASELEVIKGTELAKEAGNSKAQNVVMVGAFAGLDWIPLPKERFLKAIGDLFSGTRLEVNRKAFDLGYQAVQGR